MKESSFRNFCKNKHLQKNIGLGNQNIPIFIISKSSIAI